MKFRPKLSILFFISVHFLCRTTANNDDQINPTTSIVFATLGRSKYAFDLYSLPIHGNPPTISDELRLTDGHSVNFNGHFPDSGPKNLIYVSGRNGSSSIYLDSLEPTRSQTCLASNEPSDGRISMKDRPSLVGNHLIIYVSTHEDSGVPRTSWTAVYSTHLQTGLTRRLTPYGVADFSPAVSPSGEYTAVASYGEKGWAGEVQELSTDIYVFLTRDGSHRVKVVEHGGWPSWVDDSTFYFHRMGEDGWWSVYRAVLSENRPVSVDSVVTQRVTPPGLHAFTPAASVADKSFIAVATRRPDSEFRHIELFNVVLKTFRDLTRLVSPQAHHYNPFISPDSSRVGYHRCRGGGNGQGKGNKDLLLENIQSPRPGISLFRIDGSFPSFSPDGDRIAYVGSPGLYVVNSDGSGQREVFPGAAFSTGWDPKRKGVVYTSVGPTFASVDTKVDIISVNVDAEELSYKKLTHGGENNAFPSASPNGKWVVFRSGRSGHKNLYIMDSINGEIGGLQRLTEGPWTDTMCNWSPDEDWIAFASDRDNPGSGSFAVYKIQPNGTGLQKVIDSGSGGRTNHPWFSPDGKNIVFTTDYAGVSAEPISNPHHYQPYGDIFVMKSDGSNVRRLTHNSYEDGTPCWGPKFMRAVDVEWTIDDPKPKCSFEDCHWLKINNTNHIVEVSTLGSPRAECG